MLNTNVYLILLYIFYHECSAMFPIKLILKNRPRLNNKLQIRSRIQSFTNRNYGIYTVDN